MIGVNQVLKSKRIKEIQEYVAEHETVSLDELVNVFDVSKNTIRRDIQWLVDRGEMKKVYGGVSVNASALASFSDRKTRNQKQKELIGKTAATFVDDGDIIFVDSGTTTIEMFEYIKNKDITIITNNLNLIIECLPHDNLNVISIGGVLERKTNSFASFKESNLLNTYNIGKAFMASTGISLSNGVTNASPLESELKRAAVGRSLKVFLLIDHDKFDKQGLMTYCDLDDVNYVITDKLPDERYMEYTAEHEVEIVVAKG